MKVVSREDVYVLPAKDREALINHFRAVRQAESDAGIRAEDSSVIGMASALVFLKRMEVKSILVDKEDEEPEHNTPLSYMADGWPSRVVARKKIGEFTGGILSPRTMANLDSRGKGPRRLTLGGRSVGYKVEDLLIWMEQRATFKY